MSVAAKQTAKRNQRHKKTDGEKLTAKASGIINATVT